VLLLVSVPPTVRLVPPVPPTLSPSSSTVPVPVMLRFPVVLTVAPFASQKLPATLVSPVSALLVAVDPLSATRDPDPLSSSVPLTVVI